MKANILQGFLAVVGWVALAAGHPTQALICFVGATVIWALEPKEAK